MKFIKQYWNYFQDNVDVDININMSYRLYTLGCIALAVTIILHTITQH